MEPTVEELYNVGCRYHVAPARELFVRCSFGVRSLGSFGTRLKTTEGRLRTEQWELTVSA
mgnify:CR=1 FL=1